MLNYYDYYIVSIILLYNFGWCYCYYYLWKENLDLILLFFIYFWLMVYKTKSNFQNHPYHLVSPSPWPIYTSAALFTVTTSGVLSMHGFLSVSYLLFIALFNLMASMTLWFRDVISEGTKYNILYKSFILKITKAIHKETINQALINRNNIYNNINNDQLGYYLAGLLEGDGHIYIPALGNTTLNRILNPRIVFTSHINNLQLYAYIQSKLGGLGRFQCNGNNIRYIIGDIKGIEILIKLLHNKLRTPKNLTFNELIKFINKKYNLSFKESKLDLSNLLNNSWFAGFIEADGNFYIKTTEYKPKSETRVRSVSESISLRFRLDQRLYDKPTCSIMLPIMEKIAKCFLCNLSKYNTKSGEILSISITSINKLNVIIEYFDIHNLLGIKYNDYIDWKEVYHMFINKEHLTTKGKEKIKLIKLNMNSRRIT